MFYVRLRVDALCVAAAKHVGALCKLVLAVQHLLVMVKVVFIYIMSIRTTFNMQIPS